MKTFSVVREVPHTPDEAWRRLTEWERHGESVPFTRVTSTDVGFLARTEIGPITVDDPMSITLWDPPRECRIQKTGRVIRGWATLTVEPTATGSRVVWTEALSVRGVPGAFDGALAASGRRLFGGVLDRLLAT